MLFIERLRRRELLLGTLLTLPSPEVAEMVSRCGVDWIFMDGEHGAPTMLDWQRMMQATGGRCANLLRIPGTGETAVKRALDIGADGIIAPMVNNARQAAALVQWSRYPPEGRRGLGLARAQAYGLDFDDYVANANDHVAVVVQAEHVEAVENIEAIVEVEGIDAVFVGPYDLSASMGKTGQVDHPDVVAAIDSVSRACEARGIPRGMFGVDAAAVGPYVQEGYSLVCAGTDAGFVTGGVVAALAALRGHDNTTTRRIRRP